MELSGISDFFPRRGGSGDVSSSEHTADNTPHGAATAEHAPAMFSPDTPVDTDEDPVGPATYSEHVQGQSATGGPITHGDPRKNGAAQKVVKGAASGTISVARDQGITYRRYLWRNKSRSRWSRGALPCLVLAHLATVGSYDEGMPKVIDEFAQNALRSPGLLGFLAGVAVMTFVDANFQNRRALEGVALPVSAGDA